jgi:hypothetical protein
LILLRDGTTSYLVRDGGIGATEAELAMTGLQG